MGVRVPVLAVLYAALSFVSGGSARAQDAPAPCTSSIRVLMNRYGTEHIETGSTIWFSGVLEGVSLASADIGKSPVRIDVRNSHITFGQWQHVIAMPDATITLDPSTSQPARWWIGRSAWSTTYAPSQVSEAFFDGMPYVAPEPFIPGFSGPVTWTATFTASLPGVTVRWAWSAAVYSQFGVNGRLAIKPLRVPTGFFQNGDPAGTPERFKTYVIAGAMGSGAPQYTGAHSDTASVQPCPASSPPPIAPMQPAQPHATQVYRPRVGGWVDFLAPQRHYPGFSSPVSPPVAFADGSLGLAVERCEATDLCASIRYNNGDRLAIYSEGAAYCQPYVLNFIRTNGDRTIYSFSRNVDHDSSSGTFAFGCGRSRTTQLRMDGGRIQLTVSENSDGTLRFAFNSP